MINCGVRVYPSRLAAVAMQLNADKEPTLMWVSKWPLGMAVAATTPRGLQCLCAVAGMMGLIRPH
jgi:hypothetical protein